jgi:two-component system, LytTR family, sensor histidine kinase AlgZ
MHPLLTPINRLGLYLLAWTPITVILIYLLAVPAGLGWFAASFLIVPLCLVYEFVCLSAWYSCKATPIRKTPVKRLFLTHILAAAIVSFLWMLVAKALANVYAQFRAFQGLDVRFAPQAGLLFGAGFLLYVLAVAAHYVILALEESRQAEARAMQTSVLARDAELRALKAQVNPHFLFNSLNSINALTSIDPAKAREMCILLADFLRITLGLGERSAIPLSEELSLVHKFLAIEKVRFGARLQVSEEISEECQNMLVPPLLLQPLVENAVTHGIAHLPDGGCVRLTAQVHEGALSIGVENSFDAESTPARRGGLGLANVRQRLEGRYEKDASLRVSSDDSRFVVTLSLPAETAEVASHGR